MSFDPLSALFDVGKSVIEKIWPDPVKQAQEIRLLEELRQSGDLAKMQAQVTVLQGQMAINMQEAKHKSIFVAGWRPFVGWVCGLSLGYVSILEPIMRFIAVMVGYTGAFPVIDTTLTLQILGGMLGIAGLRTYDKKQKTQTDNL